MPSAAAPERTLLRRAARAAAWLVALCALVAGVLYAMARGAMGGRLDDDALARLQQSPEWRDGAFRNRRPRVDAAFLPTLGAFLFDGSPDRAPKVPIPVVRRAGADYAAPPPSGLRATWLGHSTVLLEIDGQRVLIDPIWSERASPLAFLGPRRFFAPPLPLGELPPVDVVLVSHDHYDHLDMPTVRALAARGARFAVPLGVGAHLRAWGVAPDSILELDWWDAVGVGELTVTATPARHFSGRGLAGGDRTLWAGWAIAGPRHRVWYSGDTALHDDLPTIGARLGPFDLTLIEIGEYDARWPDVHLGPEQAVRAHRLVRGGVMLPVHWATFDLALHGWTEPIERTLVAAAAEGVRVATPRPGDRVEPEAVRGPLRWWPALPWRSARMAPVRSTGTGALMRPLPAGSW